MEAMAEADGDDDEYGNLETEVEGLQAQVKDVEETLSVWPAELMTQAGCVVFVGNNGAASLKCGLVRPEDRSGMVQAARLAGEGDESMVSQPSPKNRPIHSDKLMRRLTAHRVAAVQAELIDRPDVALAAITAQLAQKLFRDNDHRYYQWEPAFAITATDSQFDLRSAADDMEACAAWQKMEAERKTWAGKLPEDMEAVLPWLLEQDQTTVLRLLTFAVAATVTGIYGTERDKQSNDALAAALELDMSKWWCATGPSYFNHVSKGRILEVVTEAVDANAASPLAALKKDAAVMGAEQTVAGSGWLPSCLKTFTTSEFEEEQSVTSQ